MQADFYDAYRRHWEDADRLYAASRLANADQLYGYAAECGLKCLMRQFGMPVDPVDGAPRDKKRDKVHIDGIWNRYEAYRTGAGAAGYALPQPNPFDNWSVNGRYAHESNFDRAYVDPHRAGAHTVAALVDKAILEGRLMV
jgi:hypothetical protein